MKIIIRHFTQTIAALFAIATALSWQATPVAADAGIVNLSSQLQLAEQSRSSMLAQSDGDTTLLTKEVNSPATASTGFVLGDEDGEFPPKGFAPDLLSYINSILTIVIVLALGLVLFAFIMAGFNWITAGGDKGKTDDARSRMVNAVIGILIVSASFAVLRFVGYFLGFEDFAEVISSIIPIS